MVNVFWRMITILLAPVLLILFRESLIKTLISKHSITYINAQDKLSSSALLKMYGFLLLNL